MCDNNSFLTDNEFKEIISLHNFRFTLEKIDKTPIPNNILNICWTCNNKVEKIDKSDKTQHFVGKYIIDDYVIYICSRCKNVSF